jgi:hypothetical protein
MTITKEVEEKKDARHPLISLEAEETLLLAMVTVPKG